MYCKNIYTKNNNNESLEKTNLNFIYCYCQYYISKQTNFSFLIRSYYGSMIYVYNIYFHN